MLSPLGKSLRLHLSSAALANQCTRQETITCPQGLPSEWFQQEFRESLVIHNPQKETQTNCLMFLWIHANPDYSYNIIPSILSIINIVLEIHMFISTENTKAANSSFTLRGMRSKDASSQGGFLFKTTEGGRERRKMRGERAGKMENEMHNAEQWYFDVVWCGCLAGTESIWLEN